MTQLTYGFESPFDQIRRIDEYSNEFWYARELMPFLDYPRWNDFKPLIEKAKSACAKTHNDAMMHFSGFTLKSSGRPAEDYKLSRYACYLIAMNGDSSKCAIAEAQTYFAIKTREAETGYGSLEILDDDDLEMQQLIQVTKATLDHRRRLRAIERQQQAQVAFNETVGERIEGIEAEQHRYQHSSGGMYAVLAFAKIQRLEISSKEAANLGRKATKLCRERGLEKGNTYDPRYGEVGLYPYSILEEVFELD